MNTIKDKKIIVLGAILLLFTIAYFIIVNKVSYAFDNNFDTNKLYDLTIDTIEKSAIAYGNDNLSEVEKSPNSTLYIDVQTLIDKSYLVTDSEGLIVNPLDNTKNLNAYKIKLKYENKELSAEILKS